MRNWNRLLSGVCLATGLMTPALNAAYVSTTFTRSAWNSTVAINATVDGLPNDWIDLDTGIECGNSGCPAAGSYKDYFSTMSFSGITGFSMRGVNGGGFRLDHWSAGSIYGTIFGAPAVITRWVDTQPNALLRINLPTGTTAFALDLATINTAFQNFAGTLTLRVGTGTSTQVDSTTITTSGTANTPTFFGATLDSAIDWVEIVAGIPPGGFTPQGAIGATRISFGTFEAGPPPPPPPTEMPEANTSLLVGAALIALRFLRRRA